MRIQTACAVLVFAGIVAGACKAREQKATELTADLTGATGIAILEPTVTQAFAATAASAEGVAFSTLVKIDANGNVSEVFDSSRPVFHAAVLPAHVVVSGIFREILDAAGNAIDCFLVAIPRDAAGTPAQCLLAKDPLTAQRPRIFIPENDPLYPYAYSDRPGLAVAGDTVYFANLLQLPEGPASEFRRWTAGSTETELLIYLAPGGGGSLYQPFVAAGAPNVCVATTPDASDPSNPPGQTFCGAMSPGDDWTDVGAAVGSVGPSPGLMQVGPVVLVADLPAVKVIDLRTLAVSTVSQAQNVPDNWDLTAETFDGRVVALANGKIVLLDTAGAVTVVDETVQWTRMIADGTFAWFYGGSQLRRFDRSSAVLGTGNFLGQTGMLQVTDMSFSSQDRIRLDGTASNGSPVVVAIDTSSGEISVATEDLPRFRQTTPLQ